MQIHVHITYIHVYIYIEGDIIYICTYMHTYRQTVRYIDGPRDR